MKRFDEIIDLAVARIASMTDSDRREFLAMQQQRFDKTSSSTGAELGAWYVVGGVRDLVVPFQLEVVSDGSTEGFEYNASPELGDGCGVIGSSEAIHGLDSYGLGSFSYSANDDTPFAA